MKPHQIWIDQCEAARGIEDEFGIPQALSYLIGEKFINFLDAAEDNAGFREEIPAFVAEIKSTLEKRQLDQHLETVRESEPFNPDDYDDAEDAEMERQFELRRSAADLLLVERAREWLLEEETGT